MRRMITNNELDQKQDKLVAGKNITIDPITNTISASGGGSGSGSRVSKLENIHPYFENVDIVLEDGNWNEVIIIFSASGIRGFTIDSIDTGSRYNMIWCPAVVDPDSSSGEENLAAPVHIIKTAPGFNVEGESASSLIYVETPSNGETCYALYDIGDTITVKPQAKSGVQSSSFDYTIIYK